VKSYQQFCPVARALDIVGERWTLLIVRELLWGPKRYTDLQTGLPGIGPNVLADRLRTLETAGVVAKRRLEPPAASTVYELTDLGSGLRPVVTDLFDWGLGLLANASDEDAIRASYWLPGIETAAHAGSIDPDCEDVYEFRIGEERVTIEVAGGEVHARQGSATSPDLVLQTDPETFAGLGLRRISPGDAIKQGRLRIEGDPAAGLRCARIFQLAPAAEESRAAQAMAQSRP
jgi:DNA-binding HxlR family transcriptional regulator/putative sterol carrier protein